MTGKHGEIEIIIKDGGQVVYSVSEDDPIHSIKLARSYVKAKYKNDKKASSEVV